MAKYEKVFNGVFGAFGIFFGQAAAQLGDQLANNVVQLSSDALSKLKSIWKSTFQGSESPLKQLGADTASLNTTEPVGHVAAGHVLKVMPKIMLARVSGRVEDFPCLFAVTPSAQHACDRAIPLVSEMGGQGRQVVEGY